MKDLDAIYFAARELPSADRPDFLAQACAGDDELQKRVKQMLAVSAEAEAFITDLPDDDSDDRTSDNGSAKTLKLDVKDAPDEAVGQMIGPLGGLGAGRYKLLERVGEGGCGVVYVAEQTEPVRRRVALKVIKLGMDTKQVVARFEAERQALAMMDHPNIAKVLDAGTTDVGRPFFVMELVRGIRITDYCNQANLTTKERLELFIKVCQAIQHAHQKGIIHRDIKPLNILVTLHDGPAAAGVPKVIDFGIAKATEGRLTDATVYTQLHQFIGTPAYMSPEQAEMSGLDIDTRSDIYSLGVLLYELLAGSTPFDAKELMASGIDAMRKTIREKEPVRPSTRVATLGADEPTITAKRRSADTSKLLHQLKGDLDWIVMKCLEKDRQRRYDTANGLAADLKRHLNNEPVVARPPSAAYKFQKAWKRNRVAFTAGAVVVGALVVGISISVWQAAVAIRAKNAERHLYFANMYSLPTPWEQNNLGRVRQLLEETAAFPERGFEWYYWQRQTHLELMTLRGHLGRVLAVAFSPDGQKMVTGSADNTAKVWEAASGKELLTLKGHSHAIRSIAFSPDGQRIVTGSEDNTAKVWEAASGKELLTFKGHSYFVHSLAFSPDGQRIVTGSADNTTKVWEADSGKELLTLKGHSSAIRSVAFSLDGQRIITGGSDGKAKVWEAASGLELLTLQGHSGRICSVAFSPNGQRIVTGSDAQTAKVWNAATGQELLTLKGHGNSPFVYSVAYSPDSQRIVTSSGDRTAKVWDADNGKELFTLKGHSDGIGSAAFSPDGQRILTGSDDQTAKVWKAASGQERLSLEGHSNSVNSVAFSPDGQRIVTGSDDQTAKVWQAASGQELLTLKGHGNDVTSAAFSPDGQRIVTGSFDQTAKVWEAASGKELLTLKGHSNQVYAVAFSPDSQRIVTGSFDTTAKVWEAASGKELLTLQGYRNGVCSVAFSPDGQRIVTGNENRTAKVWELANGRELLTLLGHGSAVRSVAFSPDGQRIVTGSTDNTAKVWKAASGKELLILNGHSEGTNSVAFSPDGQRIVTGSGDNTATVWEAATLAQVARWHAEEQAAAERMAAKGRHPGR